MLRLFCDSVHEKLPFSTRQNVPEISGAFLGIRECEVSPATHLSISLGFIPLWNHCLHSFRQPQANRVDASHRTHPDWLILPKSISFPDQQCFNARDHEMP
jgi:hypothetical protein